MNANLVVLLTVLAVAAHNVIRFGWIAGLVWVAVAVGGGALWFARALRA